MISVVYLKFHLILCSKFIYTCISKDSPNLDNIDFAKYTIFKIETIVRNLYVPCAICESPPQPEYLKKW